VAFVTAVFEKQAFAVFGVAGILRARGSEHYRGDYENSTKEFHACLTAAA
jgi:hypothetical protein